MSLESLRHVQDSSPLQVLQSLCHVQEESSPLQVLQSLRHVQEESSPLQVLESLRHVQEESSPLQVLESLRHVQEESSPLQVLESRRHVQVQDQDILMCILDQDTLLDPFPPDPGLTHTLHEEDGGGGRGVARLLNKHFITV